MLNTLLWWTPVSRLSCLGDMLPASLALAFISRTNLTGVRRWVRSTRYYVLLWIRCLPNIFWVMNHICPTGGPAQKTWKHHQVKRNWWSMVMRRTCQQKYLLKNIKFRENEKQLIDTNVSSAHYAGSWWPCSDSSSWTATIYPCVKTDPDPSTRKT